MKQPEPSDIDPTEAEREAAEGDEDVEGHIYIVEPQNPDDTRL